MTYMKRIKTSHFDLAATSIGDEKSGMVAIILPGFLDSKDYAHVQAHADYLAGLGCHALVLDMPGMWGSTGTESDYTLSNCLQAVNEVADTLNKPTLLVGHSNGGRIALYIAAQNKLIVGVVAIMSPLFITRATSKRQRIIDWKTEGTRHYTMDIPNHPDATRDFAVPFTFVEDSEKYQVSKIVSRVTVPKLFIAGLDDKVVTRKEVRKSYERAARPKGYRVVKAPHIYRHNPKAIGEINEAIGKFVSSL